MEPGALANTEFASQLLVRKVKCAPGLLIKRPSVPDSKKYDTF